MKLAGSIVIIMLASVLLYYLYNTVMTTCHVFFWGTGTGWGQVRAGACPLPRTKGNNPGHNANELCRGYGSQCKIGETILLHLTLPSLGGGKRRGGLSSKFLSGADEARERLQSALR